MIHQKHLDLLLDLGTDKNLHTGGALLDHLRGTHDLLHAWGNDQAVCIGGIGERAERLAFLFCVSIRKEFFEALDKDDAALWNRVHEETIPVTQDELRDLIEMEMANFVEFMPRLPFTKEELAAFEARVERTSDLITKRAYAAAKAAIETKRRGDSRPDL